MPVIDIFDIDDIFATVRRVDRHDILGYKSDEIIGRPPTPGMRA
jgi:hypothetical protein